MTEPLKSLLKYLPDKGLLLDAGCGQLTYAFLVKYFNPRLEVIPVDIVKPSVCKPSKYNFIQASIEWLPFRDETFDFIFCLSVLQLIKNDKIPIKEFHRVLRPSGLLFITIPTANSPFKLIRDMEIRCGVYNFLEYDVPHYHYYTRSIISELIEGMFYIVDLYGYKYNFIPRLGSFLFSLGKKTIRRKDITRIASASIVIKHFKTRSKNKYIDIITKLKRLFSDLSYHYIVILKNCNK